MRSSRFRIAVLALGVTMLPVAASGAQAQAQAQGESCTVLPEPVRRDTVRVGLGIQPLTAAGHPMPSLTRDQREALEAVASRLRAGIGAPVAAAPTAGSRFVGLDSIRPFLIPDISNQLLVTVGAGGVISGISTAGSSRPGLTGSTELESLLALVRAASGSPELQRITSAFRGADGGSTRLRVFTTTLHAVPPRNAPWVQQSLHERELPVFAATLATIRPKQAFPEIRDPRGRLAEREEVLLEQEIGANGRSPSATVRVLLTSSAELANLYRAWIPTVQFIPATIGGCAVSSLNRQWVHFSIRY